MERLWVFGFRVLPEAGGDSEGAARAYERARDTEAVVRLLVGKLNALSSYLAPPSNGSYHQEVTMRVGVPTETGVYQIFTGVY